ncbi:patatin-like phospholipase family protein [Parasphingorhabdus sp. DH2-15]|uniref:patatin-like phospholipase family protein n=1 Tax=Parasphingorhabdus sp. DH2-15 TaxID=3444112 RepID=UPI003F6840C3
MTQSPVHPAIAKPATIDPENCSLPLPETVALVLQGGGALGSYQGGVYHAMVESNIRIDWLAGISIGAINSAIIAGNRFEVALGQMRAFWEEVSGILPNWLTLENDWTRTANHNFGAFTAATFGVPGFYKPHMLPPSFAIPGSDNALSLYDTSPMIETLNRYVDWERLNDGPIRLSVGAVNVETGNFRYFDTRSKDDAVKIDARHIMASGALPPGFAPVEIDGQYYWDGGLVSNTPLAYVLEHQTEDMLIFQVDLFSARGRMPKNFGDVLSREKDIRYSSRTRATTDYYLALRREHAQLRALLDKLPDSMAEDENVKALRAMTTEQAANIVHLIYRPQSWESGARDFEFSRATMEQHWQQGQDAVQAVMSKRGLLARNILDGKTDAFDVHSLTENSIG